ncbi:MAG: hypothetical protein KF795_07765 [Labilithrix sp.]|nr:hypothetical protein [Labilithrix sp.]
MRLLACFATFLSVAAVACSHGDDVYIETDSTQSKLGCSLEPGEDICARDWSDVAADKRAEQQAYLDAVTSFAGEAQELRAEVADACREILTKLGIEAPAPPPTTTPEQSHCDLAAASIKARRKTSWTVESRPGSCSRLATPACLASAAPRVKCEAHVVTLAPAEAASADERAAAVAVASSFGRVLSVKARLELLTESAARIATLGTVGVELPQCLIPEMSARVSAATEDVKAATTHGGALAWSVSSPP